MASGFTRIELEFCREKTRQLMEHPLAVVFLQPVKPELDGVLDYFKVIKKPMDLGTIKKKLDSGEYANSGEWLDDVNLVWSNATTYHPKSGLVHILALALRDKCRKMTRIIPKTEGELWDLKVHKIQTKLQKHLQISPSWDALVPSIAALPQK